jgi:outer membrane receptor protein involved in Fe transport
MTSLLFIAVAGSAQAQGPTSATSPTSVATSAQTQRRPSTPNATAVSEVIVTASRKDLLGKAMTASQGSVTREEVVLRPVYRIGQLYETVPGLVVTIHSGEGKANQYLMRGFNLDHGTDFASFVDGMPVNRPTNAHGQGYSDQNFLMPQTVSGLDFTKGPYYAQRTSICSTICRTSCRPVSGPCAISRPMPAGPTILTATIASGRRST